MNVVDSQSGSDKSPYAPPETPDREMETWLPDNQRFQVIDGVLYCRSPLILKDICWLTGATEGLVGHRTQSVLVSPLWHSGVFGTFFAVFILLQVLSLKWSIAGVIAWSLFLPVSALDLLSGYVLGSRLTVEVGESGIARSRSQAWRYSMVLVALNFGCVFLWLDFRETQPATASGMMVGLLFGVALYVGNNRLRKPLTLKIAATLHSDGVYKLRGLTPEFLDAVFRIQQESSCNQE